MVLFTLLGIAAGAKLVNSAAKQHQQKANPNLNRKRFDADSREYGVATSSAGFTEQKIIDIAARCGVRPNKYGVLPENGWKHCLKYVTRYVNNPNDLANFERDWNIVVGKQLKQKVEKLKDESSKYYERAHRLWFEGHPNEKPYKDQMVKSKKCVIEIRHWHGLEHEEHLNRVQRLYDETLLGECCVKPPILRNNIKMKNSFVEIWVFGCYPWQDVNSRITRNGKITLYKHCCKHLGFDPML